MLKTKENFAELLIDLITVVNNIEEMLEIDKEVVPLGESCFSEFLQLMLGRLVNCKSKLDRDYLKCVFIGRTSNGKSSVINALLKSSIFPMGLGHTTNCFITLVTKDISEGYIEHFQEGDSDIPVAVFPLDKLKSLSHALSPVKVNANDHIKVIYPCKLSPFGPNVHLVDSPGIDIDNKYDEWIDKHCLDADIFILVTNAESVLMQCERRFFVRVKNRFSTPNLLIVNNRWDASSGHDVEESNKVKMQQMKIFSDFLVTELNACSEIQLKNRVFFVSALEEIRSNEDSEILNSSFNSTSDSIGRIERSDEFKRLEAILKENLSEKALQNRIALNFLALELTFEELNSFINCIFNTIIVQKEFLRKSLLIHLQLIRNLESDITRIHQKAANYIENLVMKAKNKISTDFQDLVCNLEVAINTIQVNFDPYNRREYLEYQKLVVDNFENALYRDLKEKTMTTVNGHLKTGLQGLTRIYTELVLSSPSSPVVNECLTIACQPPIPLRYPNFSIIMNEKINTLKSKVPSIPSKLLSSQECAIYLDSVDNRFNAYSKTQVDTVITTGASVASSSMSMLPEVTLMIPKFSAIILSDYSFSPGFRFSLSPTSLHNIVICWGNSHCPIRKKIKTIPLSSVFYLLSSGVVIYLVILYNGKYIKQGLGSVIGIYFGMYLFEKYSWDKKKEILSLKNQFTIHCKQRMETIIHISAVTTARQLGSFLHLDLKGLQNGFEGIIRDFHQQIEDVRIIESKILGKEKKFKKIKSNFFIFNQQISVFKRDIFFTDLSSERRLDIIWDV